MDFTELHTRELGDDRQEPFHIPNDGYENRCITGDPMSPREMTNRLWAIWSGFWGFCNGNNTRVYSSILPRANQLPQQIRLYDKCLLHFIPIATRTVPPPTATLPLRLNGTEVTDHWLHWSAVWLFSANPNTVYCLTFVDDDAFNAHLIRRLESTVTWVSADASIQHPMHYQLIRWQLHTGELPHNVPDLSAVVVLNAFVELLTKPRPFTLPRDHMYIPYSMAVNIQFLRERTNQIADNYVERYLINDDIDYIDDDAALNALLHDFQQLPQGDCYVCDQAHNVHEVHGPLQTCEICRCHCHENCARQSMGQEPARGINQVTHRDVNAWLCRSCQNPGAAAPQVSQQRKRRRHEAEPEQAVPQCSKCLNPIARNQPALCCPCGSHFHAKCGLEHEKPDRPAADLQRLLVLWTNLHADLSTDDKVLEMFYKRHWKCLPCRARDLDAVLDNTLPPQQFTILPYIDDEDLELCDRCHHALLFPWEKTSGERLCCGTVGNPIHFSIEAHRDSFPLELREVMQKYPEVFTKYSRQINSMVAIASLGCKKLVPRGNNQVLETVVTGGIQQQQHPLNLAPQGHLEAVGTIAHFEVGDNGPRGNAIIGNILSYIFPEPNLQELRKLTLPSPDGTRRVPLPEGVPEVVHAARTIFKNQNAYLREMMSVVDLDDIWYRNNLNHNSLVAVAGNGLLPADAIPQVTWRPEVQVMDNSTMPTPAIAFLGHNRSHFRPVPQGNLGIHTGVTFGHRDPRYDALIYPLLDLVGRVSYCYDQVTKAGPLIYRSPDQSEEDDPRLYDELVNVTSISWNKHCRARVMQLESHRLLRDLCDQYVLDRVSMHSQITAIEQQREARRRRPVENPNQNQNAPVRNQDAPVRSVFDPIRNLWRLHHSVRGSQAERTYHVEQGMTLVRHFGHPTLFITMTAGDNWPEFEENKLPSAHPVQSMDILVRLFQHKLSRLVEGLRTGRYFKYPAVYIQYKIEFQKRGKPHAHILVKLQGCDDLTPSDVDDFVSAELPRCPEVRSYRGEVLEGPNKKAIVCDARNCDRCRLRSQVVRYMIHGHRDERCKKKKPDWAQLRGQEPESILPYEDRCGLRYPFPPKDTTSLGPGGRWCYRRSAGSGLVVPYSPQLISEFDCHINTEVCAGRRSVLYLQKYFAKGPDTLDCRVTFKLGATPEEQTTQFFQLRYICSAEAYWQLFEFPFVYYWPKVVSVYAPHKKSLREELEMYDAGEGNAGEAGPAVASSLKDDVKFYFLRPEKYRNYTIVQFYAEFSVRPLNQREERDPEEVFTYRDVVHCVVKRQTTHIVNFRYHSFRNMERLSFHLLLRHIACRSIDDLLIIDGQRFNTYEEACKQRGLYAQDASGTYRGLFIELEICQRPIEDFMLAMKCILEDSVGVFLDFFEEMHRFLLNTEEIVGNPAPDGHLFDATELFHMALSRFNGYCSHQNVQLYDIVKSHSANHQITRALEQLFTANQQLVLLRQQFHQPIPLHLEVNAQSLSHEQLFVYENIKFAFEQWIGHNGVLPSSTHLHYINGMAGTGKTTLLCALYRMMRELCPNSPIGVSAYLGIAARQLPNGRTCHGLYGIPINLPMANAPIDEHPMDFDQDRSALQIHSSRTVNLLEGVNIHIIDEVSLLSNTQLQHISAILKTTSGDLTTPFGSAFIIFAGDFHQGIPIVNDLPLSVRQDDTLTGNAIFQATVLNNEDFNRCTAHTLSRPQRFTGLPAEDIRVFVEFLTKVAKARVGKNFDPTRPSYCAHFGIPISEFPTFLRGKILPTLQAALSHLSPQRRTQPLQLIAPHHDIVHKFNTQTLLENEENHAIEATTIFEATYCDAKLLRIGAYFDGNDAVPDLDRFAYVDNMRDPPHLLQIAVGTPVMLLRNMDVERGMTNGAIFIITQLHRTFVEAKCNETGKLVTIFRLRLLLQCNIWEFKRIQFPLRLAYATTINKSQGKTLNGVTIIHLQEQCFAHGQLYVALSRIKNPNDIRIVLKKRPTEYDAYATNYVLTNILQAAKLL